MKPITLFYLKNCPFCKKALSYIDELKKQDVYKNIEIEMIEESEQEEFANQYDYYYVPTFYIDGEKWHEGGIYKDEVEAIFKKTLDTQHK
jgi:glutaredoxin